MRTLGTGKCIDIYLTISKCFYHTSLEHRLIGGGGVGNILKFNKLGVGIIGLTLIFIPLA